MKVIFLCLTVAAALIGKAQTVQPILTKEDYLKKSKHQKIAGVVFIAGGVALMAAGLDKSLDGLSFNLGGGSPPAGYEPPKDHTAGILFFSGVAFEALGISLLYASKKNKRRAIEVSIKNKFGMYVHPQGTAMRPLPTLHLSIPL